LRKIKKVNDLAVHENMVTVIRTVNGIETYLKINNKELVIGDIV